MSLNATISTLTLYCVNHCWGMWWWWW